MWIVDDDGDMFNTDFYKRIKYNNFRKIIMCPMDDKMPWHEFILSNIDPDERLTRYYDLVEKLTGERIDG